MATQSVPWSSSIVTIQVGKAAVWSGNAALFDFVTDRLNRRQDAFAFRTVDIRSEWDNSIQKFCLIGDLVTSLVCVAEKEPSDFLVEQGLLVGTTEFFSKSHVITWEYEYEEHPFDWMQDGAFELFDREGRLYR